MPKVTKEHRQAKREQILDAALRCFTRNGYHKSSMRDICKEAGLSAGAVYLHFRSKEEIMEATFTMNQEARVSRLEKAMEAATPTEAAVKSTKHLFAKLADPVPDKTWQLWVQVVSEATRNPQVLKHVREGWDFAETLLRDVLRHFGFYGHDISEFISCGGRTSGGTTRYSGHSLITAQTLVQVSVPGCKLSMVSPNSQTTVSVHLFNARKKLKETLSG